MRSLILVPIFLLYSLSAFAGDSATLFLTYYNPPFAQATIEDNNGKRYLTFSSNSKFDVSIEKPDLGDYVVASTLVIELPVDADEVFVTVR